MMNSKELNAVIGFARALGFENSNAHEAREAMLRALEAYDFQNTQLVDMRRFFHVNTLIAVRKKMGKEQFNRLQILSLSQWTKEEIQKWFSPTVANDLISTIEEKGLTFSSGCIYCKSSGCVAFTHGESICG